jgi:hypothetical protein
MIFINKSLTPFIYNVFVGVLRPHAVVTIHLAAASIGPCRRFAGSECIRGMDQRAPTLVYVRH